MMNYHSVVIEKNKNVSEIIEQITAVTKQLSALAEEEKAVSIDLSVLDEAISDIDGFVQYMHSVETLCRQTVTVLEIEQLHSGSFLRSLSELEAVNRRAGGIYGNICNLLRDWKAIGKGERLDQLNSVLEKGHSLLFELDLALNMFIDAAQKDAMSSLEDVSSECIVESPNIYAPSAAPEVLEDCCCGESYGYCPAPAPGSWSDDTEISFSASKDPVDDQEYCMGSGEGVDEAFTTHLHLPVSEQSAARAKKVKPVRVDSVSFSVLSPERVKAGEYSSVDVYMYTKSQRKLIEKAIKAAKEAVKETGKSGFSVSRGTEVSIIMTSDDVKITDEVDTRTWDGECCQFDFQFFVPEDYPKKQIAFTCQVLFGGIQITRLHFTISLSSRNAARVPVRVKRKDCRKAFVSYSHIDAERVLNQLAAIVEVAPRMVFWMDSQSMENGDIWRKEIRRAIRNSDVFLLFWSVFSSMSAEVEKEWRYAKKKKGVRFILPVPLDPPAQCPPPEELGKHLHFGHRYVSYKEKMNGLTFASSKQLKRIK